MAADVCDDNKAHQGAHARCDAAVRIYVLEDPSLLRQRQLQLVLRQDPSATNTAAAAAVWLGSRSARAGLHPAEGRASTSVEQH